MNNMMKLAMGTVGFSSLLVLLVPTNFNANNRDNVAEPTSAPSVNIRPPTTKKPQSPQQDRYDSYVEDISPFGSPTASTDPIDFEKFDNAQDSNDSLASSANVNTAVQQGRELEITNRNGIRTANSASIAAQSAALRSGRSSQSAPPQGNIIQGENGPVFVE